LRDTRIQRSGGFPYVTRMLVLLDQWSNSAS